jgi:membrane protein
MMHFLKDTLIPYFHTRILPLKPVQLLWQTGLKWHQDNVQGMAAMLAYYALFSLFPLLLVGLSVAGALVGPETEAYRTVKGAIARHLPSEIQGIVRTTLVSLNTNSAGAGIVGFSLLVFSASTLFAILRQSVNQIWQFEEQEDSTPSVREAAQSFVLNKIFTFVLVLGTALLLLTSLISNIAIRTILELVSQFQSTFAFIEVDELLLTRGLQLSSSVLVLGLATAILFKVLPKVPVSWRDVWLGALLTAFLLVGIQQLASTSVVSIGGRYLSYGVIGSVMVLLVWIFMVCQIFLLGCEFSYVYAHLFGSRRQ